MKATHRVVAILRNNQASYWKNHYMLLLCCWKTITFYWYPIISHQIPSNLSPWISPSYIIVYRNPKRHGIPWEASNGEPHFCSAPEVTTAFSLLIILPSGKLTGCCGKSPFNKWVNQRTFDWAMWKSSQTANVMTPEAKHPMIGTPDL